MVYQISSFHFADVPRNFLFVSLDASILGGRFPFYLRILRKVSIFWKCSFLSQLVILSFYSIYRERPILYWETPQLQVLQGQSFQVPIEPRSSCKQYKYLCDIFSNPPIQILYNNIQSIRLFRHAFLVGFLSSPAQRYFRESKCYVSGL